MHSGKQLTLRLQNPASKILHPTDMLKNERSGGTIEMVACGLQQPGVRLWGFSDARLHSNEVRAQIDNLPLIIVTR